MAKSAAKKESKTGGVDKRKGGKRADISNAPVARLLKKGNSSIKAGDVRVGEKAAAQGVSMLQACLRKLAEECAAFLKLANKKTVTTELLEQACGKHHSHIAHANLHEAKKAELSVAGTVRYFKKYLGGKEFRMTDEAKLKLVAIAEAYLKHLGNKAGCVADNAKRSTIKARDLDCIC